MCDLEETNTPDPAATSPVPANTSHTAARVRQQFIAAGEPPAPNDNDAIGNNGKSADGELTVTESESESESELDERPVDGKADPGVGAAAPAGRRANGDPVSAVDMAIAAAKHAKQITDSEVKPVKITASSPASSQPVRSSSSTTPTPSAATGVTVSDRVTVTPGPDPTPGTAATPATDTRSATDDVHVGAAPDTAKAAKTAASTAARSTARVLPQSIATPSTSNATDDLQVSALADTATVVKTATGATHDVQVGAPADTATVVKTSTGATHDIQVGAPADTVTVVKTATGDKPIKRKPQIGLQRVRKKASPAEQAAFRDQMRSPIQPKTARMPSEMATEPDGPKPPQSQPARITVKVPPRSHSKEYLKTMQMEKEAAAAVASSGWDNVVLSTKQREKYLADRALKSSEPAAFGMAWPPFTTIVITLVAVSAACSEPPPLRNTYDSKRLPQEDECDGGLVVGGGWAVGRPLVATPRHPFPNDPATDPRCRWAVGRIDGCLATIRGLFVGFARSPHPTSDARTRSNTAIPTRCRVL